MHRVKACNLQMFNLNMFSFFIRKELILFLFIVNNRHPLALRVGLSSESFQRKQCCVHRGTGLHYFFRRKEGAQSAQSNSVLKYRGSISRNISQYISFIAVKTANGLTVSCVGKRVITCLHDFNAALFQPKLLNIHYQQQYRIGVNWPLIGQDSNQFL